MLAYQARCSEEHNFRHESDTKISMLPMLRSLVPSSGLKVRMVQLNSTGSHRQFKESLLDVHLSAPVLAKMAMIESLDLS